MIKVLIGTNTERREVIIDPATKIIDLLDQNEIDYTTGGIHLNGLSIAGPKLNETFKDMGISERCTLISVVKGDGGR